MPRKTTKMYEQIAKHGADLLTIFPDATIQDPVLLCKRLRYYERKAEISTTALCNGCSESLQEYHESALERIEDKVKKLLGITDDNQIFINRDPRGYALKFTAAYSSSLSIYKDWGGYGILAPDFFRKLTSYSLLVTNHRYLKNASYHRGVFLLLVINLVNQPTIQDTRHFTIIYLDCYTTIHYNQNNGGNNEL